MAFVSSHSQITAQKFQALMLKKDDMAADVGSVVYGEEAVSLGIIDQVGGLSDGLQCLYRQIEEAKRKAGDILTSNRGTGKTAGGEPTGSPPVFYFVRVSFQSGPSAVLLT